MSDEDSKNISSIVKENPTGPNEAEISDLISNFERIPTMVFANSKYERIQNDSEVKALSNATETVTQLTQQVADSNLGAIPKIETRNDKQNSFERSDESKHVNDKESENKIHSGSGGTRYRKTSFSSDKKLNDHKKMSKQDSSEHYGHRRNTNKSTAEAKKSNKQHLDNKKKEFLLYITLSKTIERETHLKEFLLYRMGRPKELNFEIVEAKCIGSTDKPIVISFCSSKKRSLARSLLNRSNRDSEMKVNCFDNEHDAKGIPKDRTEDKHHVLEDIIKGAEKVFNNHDKKIESVRVELQRIEKELHAKKGLSLTAFQNFVDQKPALEDKETELTLQRGEFVKYIKSMKIKIKELPDKDFDKQIRDIRVAFGAECRRIEAALPMYARREDILTSVSENQVNVVLGETGSGKSTQMVQYLFQAGFAGNGQIVCTQPRKIAAISLAQRVASEMGCSVGQEIGYRVGMQVKMSALTKVVFVTDHILLNECLKDENLSQYQCIIIDEAHERSIFTDLLLGMLKKCLLKRQELRVIVTSATIDPTIFTRYFGSICTCPVLKVSGRLFPVDVYYDEDEFDIPFPENYENKALNKAIELHRDCSVESGDILVFLTSPVETERCCEKFKQRVTTSNYNCLQLHGRLTPEEQQMVFADTRKGQRKIVFATNSAETSITIPGIRYVVDSGVAKEMQYDPQKNISSLCVVPISQSSSNQRKGRAGRVSVGTCYRLYKERDFTKMDKIGKPEILRIHLGQGLLKLMEIGVNPVLFDFVESPAPAAISSAIDTLEEIQAVEDGTITELGKWISKIPVDPRLGALVKQGIDGDVPLETLVIASYNNQKNIFYRAGTNEEKKNADLHKVEFCHEKGDIFTALNVYKAWAEVKEAKKGQWCKEKSVNGKAMKNIREMVKEITTILQKEVGVKIKYEFSSSKDKDEILQFLIFKNMISNLCVYLGHEKAGYLTLRKRQRVQLHPGSSLLPLGLQPTWTVFGQLIRTSDDFITDVTPVTDDMLHVAERNNLMSIDKDSFLNLQVKEIVNIPVGTHVFRSFVGPMHKKRRELEEKISCMCNGAAIIIDANNIRGEVSLFCLPTFSEIASDTLTANLEPISTKLWYTCIEEPVSANKNVKSTRVLIGKGGEVQDVLMPSDYNSVNVKVKDFRQYEVTEESITEMLSHYGYIQRVWQPLGKRRQSFPFWGTVTFVDRLAASAAVLDFRNDDESDIQLIPITFDTEKTKSQEFTLKLRWCRRRARDHCFVTLNNPEDLSRFLVRGSISINGEYSATVSLSKKGSDLYIRGLRFDVMEEDVRNGLLSVLDDAARNDRNRIGKIVIPRENVQLSLMHTTMTRQTIQSRIEECIEDPAVNIDMLEVKDKTVMCTAFLRFTDPAQCQYVAHDIAERPFHINGNKVNIDAEFKSSVFVNLRIFRMIETDLRQFQRTGVIKKSSRLQFREMKSGNFTIDITASSPNDVAVMKAEVDAIVEGDVLECGVTTNLDKVFTKNGRDRMQKIEKSANVLITPDERTMKVSVQGMKQNRNQALVEINDFLTEMGQAKEVVVQLKAQSNPAGLLKVFILMYGVGLKRFVDENGLISVSINLRLHELTICGFSDSIKKALEKIEVIKNEILRRKNNHVIDDRTTDCPVCLCPVEIQDMCRLEYCGHAYCNVCLTSQIENAVQSKEFPVKCASEGCGKPLVIRDFTEQIKKGLLKKRTFVDATIADFVNKNKDVYRYCPTPDCKMLYPVSNESKAFICPLCFKKVCSKCHRGGHEGITCEMHASAGRDGNSLLQWLREKPKIRRLCPKCNVGIEKDGGCQHMSCKCGAHICWLCMKYFMESSKCYGHLSSEHGGFM